MNMRSCLVGALVLGCAAQSGRAIADPIEATQVSAGGNHVCALLDDATLKCWGLNVYGQLGIEDPWWTNRGETAEEMGDNLPVVDLGVSAAVAQVAAGAMHTCALLTDGRVKCWGANGSGQLGLGDTVSRGEDAGEMGDSLPAVSLGVGRTATQISAGLNHTCALLDNGSVKCWGENSSGQLGIGTTYDRGDAAFEMGLFLPAVSLGTGRTAVEIYAADMHTCARLDDGSVKCWGENGVGELGLGDTNDRGDAANEMGDLLPAIDLGTGRTARKLAGGAQYTCAILNDGRVKCWGLSVREPVGGGSPPIGDAPNEMGDALAYVQLGLVFEQPTRPPVGGPPPTTLPTPSPVTRIAAAPRHACALMGSQLKCWGDNHLGQLGLEDTIARTEDAGNMGAALPAVDLGDGRRAIQVDGGGSSVYDSFTCALLDNGRVKCWGGNNWGQLGLGATGSFGGNPGDMGDELPPVDLGER